MNIIDYLIMRDWSIEQIVALCISVAVAIGVIGFVLLCRLADQDRARSLGFASGTPAQLRPLPKRPPHEHVWIPARTPDGDGRDMCTGCGSRRLPVPSMAAATVFVAGAPSDVDSGDWTEITPGVWSSAVFAEANDLRGAGQ